MMATVASKDLVTSKQESNTDVAASRSVNIAGGVAIISAE